MYQNSLARLRAPLSVNLEVTDKCNLGCTWCFNASTSYADALQGAEAIHKDKETKRSVNEDGGNITVLALRKNRLLRILDKLAEAEVFEVRLFGGEFSIMKHWREILQRAHDLNFFISFVSNGYLLTKEDAELFAACGVRDCTISIHGPEETHDQVTRRPGSFRRAVNAATALRLSGITVSVAYTPDKTNLRLVYDFVKNLRQNHGIENFSISRLFSDERYTGLTLQDYHYLLGEVERCHNELAVNISLADSFPRCQVPVRYWKFLSYCSQGVGFGQIDFNGSIKHCSASSKTLGNIFMEDMDVLWGEKLEHMRSLQHLPKSCKICPIFCGGGCTVSRGVDNQFAPDEFIPWPHDEGWIQAIGKAAYNRVRRIHFSLNQRKLMEMKEPVEIPKFPKAQRHRIRQEEPGVWIAMLERAGVLTLTELGACILRLTNGDRSFDEILIHCKAQFPGCSQKTVADIVRTII